MDKQKTQRFNLFRKLDQQSVVRKADRSKKAQARISKEEEKRQQKGEKENRSAAKRKKAEKGKNQGKSNNKRKPKVTAQFIDEIEFTSEELRKDEEVDKLTERGRPSRTRRVPSKFMNSFDMLLDDL